MAKIITLEEFVKLLGDDFPRFLVAGFDECADHVRSYFKAQGRPFDSMLGSAMLRKQMRYRLEDARELQFTEHDNGFFLDYPYNIGLWFEYEGMSFRAYKVKFDGAPLPGGSEARRRFFDNLESEQRHITSKDWLLNAAILWSLDKNGYLIQLRIVVPSGFDSEGQLTFALEHSLPTTTAELNNDADRHFKPDTEDDELLVRPDPSIDPVALESFEVVREPED